jgi:hypothetical protein
VCPVEEKAKIDICESDQRVTDFDGANFGLKTIFHCVLDFVVEGAIVAVT